MAAFKPMALSAGNPRTSLRSVSSLCWCRHPPGGHPGWRARGLPQQRQAPSALPGGPVNWRARGLPQQCQATCALPVRAVSWRPAPQEEPVRPSSWRRSEAGDGSHPQPRPGALAAPGGSDLHCAEHGCWQRWRGPGGGLRAGCWSGASSCRSLRCWEREVTGGFAVGHALKVV